MEKSEKVKAICSFSNVINEPEFKSDLFFQKVSTQTELTLLYQKFDSRPSKQTVLKHHTTFVYSPFH